MIVSFEKSFSAAHIYNQPKWSPERNQATFGLCYSEYGHGHNYKWKAFFAVPNTEPALLKSLELSLESLNALLEHKHLNFEVDFFKTHIPTTENIALFLANSLAKTSPQWPEGTRLIKVTLFESESIGAEVLV